MTRFFGILVIPAISAAAILYFGYYAIWGTRGLIALADVSARLSVQEERLATLGDQRSRLEHRIQLLKNGAEDPDLVEELAREQMLGSTPGQVAVPRERH
ncbi:MAG TPA: septum formation initiator family protein [Rhizomicrobium sp.]|nr:septum formation initiator family protein [Rhizomicrobium sp.]